MMKFTTSIHDQAYAVVAEYVKVLYKHTGSLVYLYMLYVSMYMYIYTVFLYCTMFR